MPQTCPCGSQLQLSSCCGRFLDGEDHPRTAEELMRSRYSAYVLECILYLRDTLWPKNQPHFDAVETARRATDNHWTGLTVIDVHGGGSADREGTVLFEAKFLAQGRLNTHRELSRFRKKARKWYYVEALSE